MTCNSCGKELPEGAAHCAYCGAPVGASTATPVVNANDKMGSKDLGRAAWQVMKVNIKVLAMLEGIFLAFAIIMYLTLGVGAANNAFADVSASVTATAAIAVALVYGLLRLVVVFAQMFVVDGKTQDPKQALQYGLKRFLPVLGYVVLLGIVSMFAFITPFGAGFLSRGLGSGAAIISPIILFPIAVYVLIRFSQTLPLALFNEGPGNKLAASWNLTKGKSWYIFKSLLLLGVISFIVQIAFQLVGAVLPGVAGVILSLVVQSAVQIFSVAYFVLLFRSISPKA